MSANESIVEMRGNQTDLSLTYYCSSNASKRRQCVRYC